MPGSFGQTDTQDGVTGTSTTGRGVAGESASQAGVVGTSQTFVGVWGESQSPASAGQPGVFGKSPHWQGVHGESTDQAGVFGESPHGQGVHGESTDQAGVAGFSTNFVGVWGESHSAGQPGIFGKGPALAARFEGNVEVTGDIKLVNADVAEDFDVAGDELEPGMVTVFDAAGALCASSEPYDRRVAGVVAGAGDLKPGVVLGRNGDPARRLPVALVGRAFCKVDARYGPIGVGDLLTTSPTPGHAMKALDPQRAFGAVIGKALKSFVSGRGAIPVLIALQ